MGTSDAEPGERIERLERAVAELSERVEALELQHTEGTDAPSTAPSSPSGPPSSPPAAPSALPERLWALSALKERLPAPGGVVYTGSVDLPVGHLEYQWGRGIEHLLAADWADRSDRLAALGHPLRLAMLRLLLNGEHTVAQLVDELELASTGIAYHHLNQLHGEGWVTSLRRGVWTVPHSRVIPLLAIITALEEN